MRRLHKSHHESSGGTERPETSLKSAFIRSFGAISRVLNESSRPRHTRRIVRRTVEWSRRLCPSHARFERSQGMGYLNMAFSTPQLEQATGVEPQLTSRAPMSPQDTLASAEHGELL